MPWLGGGAALAEVCSSFALRSLFLGMSLAGVLRPLFECLWRAVASCQQLRARLNLHAAKDNFPQMTATWHNQAYAEDAKQDPVSRETSMSLYFLLPLSRLRVGQMDMQMAALRG
jgi:hypothetical protein